LNLSSIGTYQRGSYSVTVTNAFGSVTSSVATVSVAWNARIVNLSTRAYASSATPLVPGFTISGSGSKALLLRAIGPTLGVFGVPGTLAQPQMTLFDSSGDVLAIEGPWGDNPAVAATMSQVGAFGLAANSADVAFDESLGGGSYSGQIIGLSGTAGIVLAEIYDADIGPPADRLVNISTRGFVGTGANVMTGGFNVLGTTSETLLIRGIGPTLSEYGISGVLPSTELTIYNSSGQIVATNAGWGGNAVLASLFNLVGAFGLPTNSADSAMVVTLPPGGYTVQLAGQNSATGIGMVEVYEVPE
jgi:hypothetical protein